MSHYVALRVVRAGKTRKLHWKSSRLLPKIRTPFSSRKKDEMAEERKVFPLAGNSLVGLRAWGGKKCIVCRMVERSFVSAGESYVSNVYRCKGP